MENHQNNENNTMSSIYDPSDRKSENCVANITQSNSAEAKFPKSVVVKIGVHTFPVLDVGNTGLEMNKLDSLTNSSTYLLSTKGNLKKASFNGKSVEKSIDQLSQEVADLRILLSKELTVQPVKLQNMDEQIKTICDQQNRTFDLHEKILDLHGIILKKLFEQLKTLQ